jgi:cation diffusion facilitator CzcD-associated flavoprotein CzcO
VRRVDVIVVGAGFAGLYMLHRLRTLGVSTRVLEAGDGIGGTWFWNCYPGARCDVESIDYSYSFDEQLEQEWEWSERYPSQPEVLRYLNHVADRFDLRGDIQLETRVTAARFDEEGDRWTVETDRGEEWSAQHLVLATGCLSAAQIPEIPGLDSFAGAWYHTARWPKEAVDFTGKRVGVIGTGSTGIQVVPEIAPQADHLYVFQRTANFSVPNMNRALNPKELRELKARYRKYRQAARESFLGVPLEGTGLSALEVSADELERDYETRWRNGGGMQMLTAYNDLLVDKRANDTIADFVRRKIHETVRDPETADTLTPRDYPLGTKRLAQDDGYFETFNRDNVTLVDIRRAPIEEITPTGLRTAEGEYELDAIVFATGFDAVTGPLLAIDIRGRGVTTLRDKWRDGPHTYLGLAVTGFPNMFVITGPGSPSVLSNMVVSIEQHVEWIADAITYMSEHGFHRIEATEAAQEGWTKHVAEVGETTLFPLAESWYVGANIPGKPRVFLPYVGGVGPYRQICDDVAAKGYEGFTLS